MTFSDLADIQFHFDDYQSLEDTIEAIAVPAHLGGGRTNTQRALDYAGVRKQRYVILEQYSIIYMISVFLF